MNYKYANEEQTLFNIFIDGSLRKSGLKINDEILEREGIALDDIEAFQTAEELEAAEQKTLEDAKSDIDSARLKKEMSFDIEVLGRTYDFSLESVSKFTSLYTLADEPIMWRPKGSREYVSHTLEEAKLIGKAIAAKLYEFDQEAQAAKAALEDV